MTGNILANEVHVLAPEVAIIHFNGQWIEVNREEAIHLAGLANQAFVAMSLENFNANSDPRGQPATPT